MPERPIMWYFFEKRIVQGFQKLYSHVSNAQIQKYKYKIHKYSNTKMQIQNTQIQQCVNGTLDNLTFAQSPQVYQL